MIKEAVEKSADACEEWIKKPFLQVMNTYNHNDMEWKTPF